MAAANARQGVQYSTRQRARGAEGLLEEAARGAFPGNSVAKAIQKHTLVRLAVVAIDRDIRSVVM